MPKTTNLEQGIRLIESRINELYTGENIVFVGVAGGSCSGKSYLSNRLRGKLGIKILSMDDYYKGKDFMEQDNYDITDSIELGLFENHLSELRRWNWINKPIYDFKENIRMGYESFKPEDKLIVEGLFCFYNRIRDLIDIKVFVDAYEDIRLNRGLERDVVRQGHTEYQIMEQWDKEVQPCYLEYVEHQKQYADIIIKNE